MKALELFAGAGGLAMGTSKAGFRHSAVVEWNKDACDTIRENQVRGMKPVANWPLFQTDIRHFDFKAVGKIDLLAGGPPCQPFSLGGKHQGHRDERNMFPEAVRGVRELAPKAIVLENVKGLTRRSFAVYFEYIVLQNSFPEIVRKGKEDWALHLARLRSQKLGRGLTYKVSTKLLNAADFGVPQKRERVFFVGFRSDLKLEWKPPVPTHSEEALMWDQWVSADYWERHRIAKNRRPSAPLSSELTVDRLRAVGIRPKTKPWRTVRDAIADLPNPSSHQAKNISNHAYIPGARVYPGHTGSPLDRPAKTLKAGGHGVPGGENMIANLDGTVRYFTIRESARLQSFPDDYYFPGSWTETMRQLGNAVPVALGEAVAGSVANVLEK